MDRRHELEGASPKSGLVYPPVATLGSACLKPASHSPGKTTAQQTKDGTLGQFARPYSFHDTT